jgi:hypothetical protein
MPYCLIYTHVTIIDRGVDESQKQSCIQPLWRVSHGAYIPIHLLLEACVH